MGETGLPPVVGHVGNSALAPLLLSMGLLVAIALEWRGEKIRIKQPV